MNSLKKKLLECDRHGLTLFRCKRKYWKIAKDKIINEYTEKCFKCISEGRYKNTVKTKVKKQKHLSIR